MKASKTTKYDLKAKESLALLHATTEVADGSVVAIFRHSARHYPESPAQEAFMTLTNEGKAFAFNFGQSLCKEMKPRIFSSSITRCMETAYLVAMGYAETHGLFPYFPIVQKEMTPFYMKDIPAAVARQREVGHDVYLRMWLNRELPGSEIEDPEVSAKEIVRFMATLLDQLSPQEIGFGTTHDWNLFPIKEFLLYQLHEEVGQVGYLETIALFRKKGQLFLQGICGESVVYTEL